MIMRNFDKQKLAGNKNKEAGLIGQLESLLIHHVPKMDRPIESNLCPYDPGNNSANFNSQN